MNATDFLKSLDAEELRERIKHLDEERESLMVLLRATLRRGHPQASERRNGGADDD